MSKRGSKNAIRFAGKNWSLGRKGLKTSKSKIVKSKRKKLENQKLYFTKVCKSFALKRTLENEKLKEKIFDKYSQIYKRKLLKRSVKNVQYFKIYCEKFEKDFNLNNYITGNYHIIDFKENFPELITILKTKKKNSKKVPKPIKKVQNTLENFLPEEILLKLKRINNEKNQSKRLE